MISPFPVTSSNNTDSNIPLPSYPSAMSPITNPPSSLPFVCMRVLPHTPTLSCPTAPLFPYSGASNLPRTKDLPPITVGQGHPLLHMYLEPKIPLGIPLGWWSRLWENWVVRSAYVVLPMGFQSPSAPTVLLPAPHQLS